MSVSFKPAAQNTNTPTTRTRRQADIDSSTSNRERSQPLLETDVNNQSPPLAGPEIDDMDADNRRTVNDPQPGVDDGFFQNKDAENIPKPEAPRSEVPDLGKRPPAPIPGFPARRNSFPRAPGYDPEYDGVDGTYFPGSDMESIPDVNVYQHKKTLAQGMMDLALFSANANQLRYVLESYDRHPYYYPSLVLISISLLFQVAVGVGLIWNAKYNVKDKKEICMANKISNFTIIGIFLVTVINVFVSAFGVANAPSSV